MKTYTDISVQLLEDSVQNVEALLSEALGEDFGKKRELHSSTARATSSPVHHGAPGVSYFPNGSTTFWTRMP